MSQLILATPRYLDRGHRFLMGDLRRLSGEQARTLAEQAKFAPEGADYLAVSLPVKQVLKNVGGTNADDSTQRDGHERLILTGSGALSATQRARVIAWLNDQLAAWERHWQTPQGEERGFAIQSPIIAQWETELAPLLSATEEPTASTPTVPNDERSTPNSPAPPRPAPRTVRRSCLTGCTLLTVIAVLGISFGLWIWQRRARLQPTPEEVISAESTDSSAFLRNHAWSALAQRTGLPPKPTPPQFASWLRTVHDQYLPQQFLRDDVDISILQSALANASQVQPIALAGAKQTDPMKLLNDWTTNSAQPEPQAGRDELRSLTYTIQSSPNAATLTCADLAKLVRLWSIAAQHYAQRPDLHPSVSTACADFSKTLKSIPTAPTGFDVLTPADLLRWHATERFVFQTETLVAVLSGIQGVKDYTIDGKLAVPWETRLTLLRRIADSPLITAAEVQLAKSLIGALPKL